MRTHRGLWLVLLGLCADLAAAAPAKTVDDVVRDALLTLKSAPYIVPVAAGDASGEAVVQLRWRDNEVSVANSVTLRRRSTPDLGQALSRGRGKAPPAWLLVTSRGRVTYWVALRDPRAMHAEWEENESGRIGGTTWRVGETDTWVRVPGSAGDEVWIGEAGGKLRRYRLPPPTPRAQEAVLAGSSCSCPEMYVLRDSGSGGETLDVLFLPDGFTPKRFGCFRQAAHDYLADLLATAPFDEYACRVNAYVAYLASEQDGIDALPGCQVGCNGLCESEWDADGTACPALDTSQAVGLEDSCDTIPARLETRHCAVPGADNCRILFPSRAGMVEARRLATECASEIDIDLVIILSNSCRTGGGGTSEGWPGIAMTSTCRFDKSDRARLLTHEVGHAFGLYDEYDHRGACSGFECGRNVVGPASANDPLCATVPWENSCDPKREEGGCSPPDVVSATSCRSWHACVRADDPSTCINCGDPALCVDCEAAGAKPGCRDATIDIGLFEGAFCASCGYWTSTRACRMDNFNDAFCRPCKQYVRTALERHGISACQRIRPPIIEIGPLVPGTIPRTRGCPPDLPEGLVSLDLCLGRHRSPRVVAEIDANGLIAEVNVTSVRLGFGDSAIFEFGERPGDARGWRLTRPSGATGEAPRVLSGAVEVTDRFGRTWRARKIITEATTGR